MKQKNSIQSKKKPQHVQSRDRVTKNYVVKFNVTKSIRDNLLATCDSLGITTAEYMRWLVLNAMIKN